jgi:CheY-like chemotaxis protein
MLELHRAVTETISGKDVTAVSPAGPQNHVHVPAGKLKILAVEDNPVNQSVLRGILGNFKHDVTIVATGVDAVKHCQKEDYDLVLMDVQMPEMNGYEATQAIRAYEVGTGKHVPIVAMTAYAMKGDREKCLGAGMDDYVSKPVQKAKLVRLLEIYGHKKNSQSNAEMKPVFDRSRILDEFGGNEEAVDCVIQTFLRTSPDFFQSLLCAISISDVAEVQRWAHTLKGNVGFFGADDLAQVLFQVETGARNGEVETAKEKLPQLEKKMKWLMESLRASLSY